MFIVRNRKIFFGISVALILASTFCWFYFKPSFGVDFVGGSILEVSYQNGRPSLSEAHQSLSDLSLGNYSLRPSGEDNFVLRTTEISEEEKAGILSALSFSGQKELSEERFNTIGPVVGESLKRKSIWAVGTVFLGIVLFITFAFRKVSEPVSSWKYGLSTIIALAHDVIIPTGAYIIFGRFFLAEIDLLFVTALLAILGYSVHDSIVVFDRVRENLKNNQESNAREPFEETVGKSLMQTMGRSINTSLTLILVLVALFVLGSESVRSFTFLLIAGVVVGTYSSIFVGSPLLVTLEKLKKGNK